MLSNDVCFTKKKKNTSFALLSALKTQSFNMALTMKGLWKTRPKDVENYTQRVFENTNL